MNSFIRLIENALYPFRVINGYFGRFFRRIGGPTGKLSLAAKIALAFFICFVLFITIVWVVGAFSDQFYRDNSITGTEWDLLDFPIYYLIALLLSVAVYWGVRLATRERPTLYPEIDQCWEPLEQWREKQNFLWHEFRRYLVLGPTLEVSKAMHAEMKDRKIGALPAGENEWMHWFGTNENVYLHLKKVSNTSERLLRLRDRRGRGGIGDAVDPANTLQVSVGVQDWSASIGVDDVTAEVDSSFGATAAGFGGSLDAAHSLDPYDSGSFTPPPGDLAPSEQADDDDDGELGEDGDTPRDRLEYLSRLIKQKTEGQIPFHGVVVVIPFDKFIAKENHKTIAAAIKNDLLILREETDVAFPVSFVFCSMEKDQGFPKLQNLLGAQRATTGRFGAGCRKEDIPVIDKTNLETQVQRACRSFEDWVINRWGKSTQLSRAAQNKELFKLVVRIRQRFRPCLEHLLEQTLIWNRSELVEGEQTDLTLTGCYFVSTGEHSADRGFLNGVFLKCEEFAETVSWGEKMLNRDRVYSVFATLLFAASVLVVLGVAIWAFFSVRS